jgi:hypothetical protein
MGATVDRERKARERRKRGRERERKCLRCDATDSTKICPANLYDDRRKVTWRNRSLQTSSGFVIAGNAVSLTAQTFVTGPKTSLNTIPCIANTSELGHRH